MRFTLLLSFILLLAAPLNAATIYVDANGTVPTEGCSGDYDITARSCSGSDGDAYETLTQAVAAASNGDVLSVRKGTWAESAGVEISNFSNLTISAYTGEGWDDDPTEGNHPAIDMNNYEAADGLSQYAKILYIHDSSDITIDGLELREYSEGIYVEDSDNVTIQNTYIHHTYLYGLVFANGTMNSEFGYGEIAHGVYRKHFIDQVGGGIVVFGVNGAGNNRIHHSKIHDSCWEGVNIGRCSTNAVLEYNEIYGNNQVQVYILDINSAIVRYNLIYGTELGPNVANVPDGYGSGIWVSSEDHPCGAFLEDDTFNVAPKIYGNLVANTGTNLYITQQADAAHDVANTQVYNNTFVGAKTYDVNYVTARVGTGHQFKNNAIWRISSTSGITSSIASGYIDSDYNLWSEAPDSDIQGGNDPSYDDPGLAKASGWNTGTGGYIDVQDFIPDTTVEDVGSGGIGSEFRYLLPQDEADITAIMSSDLIDNYPDADIGGIPYAAGGAPTPPEVDIITDGGVVFKGADHY